MTDLLHLSNPLLFVYGTLLVETGHPMSVFMQKNGCFVNHGYIRGRLYLVADYPGAIISDIPDDKVWGKVYHLSEQREVWDLLDRYEGYVPSSPAESLFIRAETTVYTDNKKFTSWCYLYNQPVAGLERIESGDYIDYHRFT